MLGVSSSLAPEAQSWLLLLLLGSNLKLKLQWCSGSPIFILDIALMPYPRGSARILSMQNFTFFGKLKGEILALSYLKYPSWSIIVSKGGGEDPVWKGVLWPCLHMRCGRMSSSLEEGTSSSSSTISVFVIASVWVLRMVLVRLFQQTEFMWLFCLHFFLSSLS